MEKRNKNLGTKRSINSVNTSIFKNSKFDTQFNTNIDVKMYEGENKEPKL